MGDRHSLTNVWPVKDKWVWVGYGSVAECLPSVSGALGSIPAQDKKSHQREVGEGRHYRGGGRKPGGRQAWMEVGQEGVLKTAR